MWGGISLQFCIFLITDVEHLFMYLLAAICMSLKKYLFKSFAYYLIGLLIFLLLSFRDSLYIIMRHMIYKYFLLFCGLPFYSTDNCILYPNFKFLRSPVFFFFLLLPVPLGSYTRNHCPIQCYEAFVLWFLLRVLLF